MGKKGEFHNVSIAHIIRLNRQDVPMHPVQSTLSACPQQLPRFHFEAHGMPSGVNEALRQSFGINFDVSVIESPDKSGDVDFTSHLLGGIVVVQRRMPAHRVSRADSHICAGDLDHYCLRVPSNPSLGAESSPVPMFADLAQPMRHEFSAGSDALIFFPREALDALLPRHFDLHGAQIKGKAGELLNSYVQALCERLDCLHTSEAAALSRATLHMAAAALLSNSDSLPLAHHHPQESLVRRIGQYIDEHVADPDLSPTQLCDAFKMSRTTLFRVMSSGGGPATAIRERRLARAHSLLTGAGQRVYLKRTASDCGFKDASHFSRAFRERYGYSPREAANRGAVHGDRLPTPLAPAVNQDHPVADWLQAMR